MQEASEVGQGWTMIWVGTVLLNGNTLNKNKKGIGDMLLCEIN